MRKLKSYSNIWKVERILYAVNDVNLPFPVTFHQIGWAVMSEVAMIYFGGFIPDWGIRYIGVPLAVTLLMSKVTFDGKKPYNYFRAMLLYAFRPKVTFGGKRVTRRKEKVIENITMVRSEIYVPG